ncbi:UNVERIFIED_CONTAM: hypothetical protein Sradi_5713800 [Sesamum radiatum]|uniref:Reverse transcriptase RNase H-like domain-containing protein n=1 Tax=Sesamum radiatum TaxID=300843 RepID=A0AAW2L1M6_SESRA
MLVRAEGKEHQPIYYVSKVLQRAVLRYLLIEKLALALIVAARKLRPYFQSHQVIVLTNQPLKTILASPNASEKMTKWAVKLSEHSIEFEPRSAIKVQALLDRESLHDAWKRFKNMLRKYPHHELLVWRQVGTIMKKLPSKVFNIIDEIATNMYSYGQERTDKKITDIHSVDAISALSAQMTPLTHKVDNVGTAMWNGAPIGPCVVHAVK